MDRRTELSRFLRSRRDRLSPEDAGLVVSGTRRVTGLRREEVAQLAGVSVDHYVRLEQGRNPHVSTQVLDAVARALRLSPDESRHLHNLARPPRTTAPSPAPGVRRSLRILLDGMDGPAYVVGPHTEFIAWNELARAVFADFPTLPVSERNAARLVFLDAEFRALFGDSLPRKAADTVAYLRMHLGRHGDDPALVHLVGTLSVRSEHFRELWARQDVRDKSHGRYRLRHPLVGDLELHYEALHVGGDDEQTLVCYGAEPGSASADALQLVASWAAPNPSQPTSEATTRDE